jgi:hypothetical protein
MASRTYWPGLRRILEEYARYRGGRGKKMEVLLQLDTTHQADLVALDTAVNNILKSVNTNWPAYSEPS